VAVRGSDAQPIIRIGIIVLIMALAICAGVQRQDALVLSREIGAHVALVVVCE
jgi:hypothetical protein